MATHSSILAWRIPRAEEPGGLQSMELENFSESVGGGQGRGAAGPGGRGLSLLWQRRRRGRANTQKAHSLPGAASVLRAKEPLRREPASLLCNKAVHAFHAQGVLHP